MCTVIIKKVVIWYIVFRYDIKIHVFKVVSFGVHVNVVGEAEAR